MRSRHLAAVLSLGIAASTALAVVAPVPVAAQPAAAAAAPKVGHVWTIVLENEEFEQTFLLGRLSAPYLTSTLTKQGRLLVQYYGTGHSSLDNYIAMESGQGPNPSTQGDCDDATTLGGPDGEWHFDADGQAIDDSGASTIGCTYPAGVKSLPDQFDAAGVSWKGYMENMDAQPGKPALCANPYSTGPAVPERQIAEPDYADKHNPFGYFHSITDRPQYCDDHVVPMGYVDSSGALVGPLADDLKSVATTPQYSFITPGKCHDGHDACASNGNSQFKGIDQFLQEVVPAIQASPAYQQDGLIIITFDEGTTDLFCCGEKKAPNLGSDVDNGYPIPLPIGDGGGMTGALLLSPLVKANSVDLLHQFNHYSYLRSMEDLFGITTGGTDGQGHLGYAAQPGLVTFQQAGEFPG